MVAFLFLVLRGHLDVMNNTEQNNLCNNYSEKNACFLDKCIKSDIIAYRKFFHIMEAILYADTLI